MAAQNIEMEMVMAMKATHAAANLKLRHTVASAQGDISIFVQNTSQPGRIHHHHRGLLGCSGDWGTAGHPVLHLLPLPCSTQGRCYLVGLVSSTDNCRTFIRDE
jgi:hypothetical protein